MASPARLLSTAQHEAAHVVVGLALGLRLRLATLARAPLPGGYVETGHTAFCGRSGAPHAWATMYAAGIAWEHATRGHSRHAAGDRAILRGQGWTPVGMRTLVTCAAAILATRGPAHARVTRILIERDLTSDDAVALARGDAPDDA